MLKEINNKYDRNISRYGCLATACNAFFASGWEQIAATKVL